MLKLSNAVELADWEIEIHAIRSQGAGGQRVNKVATAIHLRFDIQRSTLPLFYKTCLLALADQRITKEGVIVIKSQQFRTQEQNKEAALQRLKVLIKATVAQKKTRRKTKATKGSQRRRMDKKTHRGQTKVLRGKVDF